MRISDWSSDVCSSDLPALSRFRNPPQARRKPVSKPGTVHQLRHPLGRKQQVDLMIGQRIQAFDIVFEPAVGVNCFADIITTERSEEHTSELQSLMRISYAVFCLKKKKSNDYCHINTPNYCFIRTISGI